MSLLQKRGYRVCFLSSVLQQEGAFDQSEGRAMKH
jgi:hypothetical protein